MSDDDDDDEFVKQPTRPRHARRPSDSERRRKVLDKIYGDIPPESRVVAEPMSPRAERSARMRDSDSEQMRRVRVQTSPYGALVPLHREQEITAEHEVLDREPRAEEMEIVRRSKRDSGDPLTVSDGAKILKHIEHLIAHRLEESSKRERTLQAEGIAQIRALVASPPHEAVQKLQVEVEALKAERAELTEIKRFVAGQRKVLNWIGGGLLTFVVAVGVWLYSRGVTEGRSMLRLENLERRIDSAIPFPTFKP